MSLEVKVSAPGKVILHGEHSVMYGKFAIAASLGLRTSIVIKEVNSNELFIHLKLLPVGLDDKLALTLIKDNLLSSSNSFWDQPKELQHEKHLENVNKCLDKVNPNYEDVQSVKKNSLRGFFYLLSGILHRDSLDKSIEVGIDSELTVGAGTGSSASFAVCLSAALIQFLKLKKGIEKKEFSLEDKMLISEWAYNCEKIMHGAPSGIDNSTCTFGSLVGFTKGEKPVIPDYNLNLQILLIDTKISRQTKILAEKVKSLRDWNTDAVNAVMDALGYIANNAAEIMKKLAETDEKETNILYQRLSKLWNMNHCLLASLGVSHPALENIRSSALKYDLACKLTGAGGGGYAIILIPPKTDEKIIKDLSQELLEKGFSVRSTELGGPGVTLDLI